MSEKSFIQHDVENKNNENKKMRKQKLEIRINNFKKLTYLKKNQKK